MVINKNKKYFYSNELLNQVDGNIIKKKHVFISKEFISNLFFIYNGKTYIEHHVKEKQLGYSLGSFAITKKICIYKKEKRKAIKKKKKKNKI